MNYETPLLKITTRYELNKKIFGKSKKYMIAIKKKVQYFVVFVIVRSITFTFQKQFGLLLLLSALKNIAERFTLSSTSIPGV